MARTTSRTGSAIGVSLGAIAAAVAGAYYFYGKNSAKHRGQLRTGMVKVKREITRQVKKIKNLDRKTYLAIVDRVAQGYRVLKGVDKNDLSELVAELRDHWESLKPRRTRHS